MRSSARSASSRAFPWCWRSFFQPLHKHRHFLFCLAVALLARRLDAAPVRFARLVRLALIRERTSERLPGGGVKRIAFHRVAQILRRARRISRLGVLEPERIP